MTDSHIPPRQPAARDLVVAVVGHHPKSILLLHAARERAREINGRWRILYIEPGATADADAANSQDRLSRLLSLAEQMGGEVQHVRAETMDNGLRKFLENEKENLAWIIVGSDETRHNFLRWRKGVYSWERVVKLAGQYARVDIIPLGVSVFKLKLEWPSFPEVQFSHFFFALLAVGVAYMIAVILENLLPPALFRINIQNISLLFMTACAFTAGRYGLLPGLFAAAVGAVTYNYYYVPPYHELSLLNVTKGLNMALFFGAAALISIFTGQARLYGERSERRERSTQVLLMLYRIASTAFSRLQALETLRQKLHDILHVEAAFFLPPIMQPGHVESVVPANLSLDERDRRALDACWSEMKTTGLAAPSHPLATWRFEPMVTQNGVIGVFAARPREGRALQMWEGNLLSGIADQTAIIIEHFELTHLMESTRIRDEREKLRSMLLSSVSHDLKTPLAGIIGSLGVHRSIGDKLTPERRAELLSDALEEAQRLDSFITNILDITRLESGRVEFHLEWHDINTIVSQVAKRMQHRLQARRLVIVPCTDMIEVYMDPTMTEQILQNLLDNACKYTPDGTQITVTSYVREGFGLCCDVRDNGKGIPENKLDTVFDKYARLHKEDTQVAGTGLGLSICKVVMEAQGGWITANNHPDGGAVFTFCFPRWRMMSTTPLEDGTHDGDEDEKVATLQPRKRPA